MKEGKVKDGTNFLKAQNEKPEYVCTCCHWLLFHKTVRNFLIDEYDYTNETVQKCLAHQYTSEQNVPVHLAEQKMKHQKLTNVQKTLDIQMWKMNSFVYIVETHLDKKTQKCLIRPVQMALI